MRDAGRRPLLLPVRFPGSCLTNTPFIRVEVLEPLHFEDLMRNWPKYRTKNEWNNECLYMDIWIYVCIQIKTNHH